MLPPHLNYNSEGYQGSHRHMGVVIITDSSTPDKYRAPFPADARLADYSDRLTVAMDRRLFWTSENSTSPIYLTISCYHASCNRCVLLKHWGLQSNFGANFDQLLASWLRTEIQAISTSKSMSFMFGSSYVSAITATFTYHRLIQTSTLANRHIRQLPSTN